MVSGTTVWIIVSVAVVLLGVAAILVWQLAYHGWMVGQYKSYFLKKFVRPLCKGDSDACRKVQSLANQYLGPALDCAQGKMARKISFSEAKKQTESGGSDVQNALSDCGFLKDLKNFLEAALKYGVTHIPGIPGV